MTIDTQLPRFLTIPSKKRIDTAARRLSSPPTRPFVRHNGFRPTRTRSQDSLPSAASSPNLSASEHSSAESMLWSESSSDSESLNTPVTDLGSDIAAELEKTNTAEVDLTKTKSQLASTTLVTQDPSTIAKVVGDGEDGTQLIRKYCCGGGCCYLNSLPPVPASTVYTPLDLPDNAAFRSLNLKLLNLNADTQLTNIVDYPTTLPTLSAVPASEPKHVSSVSAHPPTFVQPHPPYSVFSAPLFHARELTKPGAEKRTFHFDIDVTDYPEETGVDFKVGGAVGVQPANDRVVVEEIFDILGVPRFLRDKPTLLRTVHGRWPTVWGDEAERSLVTTRREILTWCTDIQSYPPSKNLFRVMAEHTSEPNERKILMFLASAQGQPAFCDIRTGPHLSVLQLLKAFPSSRPPFEDLIACLSQLYPRFYSLSNDPHVSSEREGLAGRRLIEIAVTIHEKPHWDEPRKSTGVGSGFLERLALRFIEAEKRGEQVDLRVPLFRGLMSNPLSKQFSGAEGPMMLIGAGVGMAPFRGFILNRLKNASCASKIWLVQGVRDSQVDELYSGELGQYEAQIKRVVQSRVAKKSKAEARVRQSLADLKHSSSEADISALRAKLGGPGLEEAARELEKESAKWKAPSDPDIESKYVQDEVRQQADVVWDIISSHDGRIFVCGSSKGMGEGVEQALREVVMQKKGMTEEAAAQFWKEMVDAGKYIAETW